MHVRHACEQDADAACSVIRRSISELCALDHQGDAATLERWLANKTPANVRAWIGKRHVLVAVDESAILGVAAMTASGEIILNYVSPDSRFRGASKALVQSLEARAASLGIPLLTLRSTATAVRFYRAARYYVVRPGNKVFRRAHGTADGKAPPPVTASAFQPALAPTLRGLHGLPLDRPANGA